MFPDLPLRGRRTSILAGLPTTVAPGVTFAITTPPRETNACSPTVTRCRTHDPVPTKATGADSDETVEHGT